MKKRLFLWLIAWGSIYPSWSQPSVAHQWVNDLLFCITNDFARPPIHARNLHHLSIVMHDGFAAYKPGTKTILLNNNWHGFQVPFLGVDIPDNVQLAQETTISYAAFRLLSHRFQNAPGAASIFPQLLGRMAQLGFDPNFTSTDYINHGAAALGNYLAEQIIAYGLLDGSNEQGNYANQYYTDGNPVIEPELPGNPNMINPNRFQRISLTNAIDQAGNPVLGAPPALAPEWGNVYPFSLKEENSEILERDGGFYKVYFNPGHPPYLDTNIQTGIEDFFKWNFLMVSVWQAHLDTLDNVLWDISPGSIGNVDTADYPDTWADYQNFYNFFDGGDIGTGHAINPITYLPYEEQIVRRGDYARILAEFWADGLDSETPPGHWFKIYNEVSQHQLFERKWKGDGPELSVLEYDIKAYLLLGGTMHDAAIAAWAVKGYYDYLRPVSAIRYMGDRGQSSDINLPNYHPAGLPLVPGFVELVSETDPLVGNDLEHLNKIKLYTWRGHDYVDDPHTDMAGVGWILCENWWPYQRPTFVTPPFAGYVSGHSTYSRAAAKAMDFMTGTPYFPGGMSNFVAEQNEFLEFEIGPSETVILQWATYYDASDQCSLSRIWGGIHPPIDDIPGRKIGQKVGIDAAAMADSLLSLEPPKVIEVSTSIDTINSFSIGQNLIITVEFDQEMDVASQPEIVFHGAINFIDVFASVSQNWLSETVCEFAYQVMNEDLNFGMLPFSVVAAQGSNALIQSPALMIDQLYLDTKKPEISQIVTNDYVINSQIDQICLSITMNEACDTNSIPSFFWTGIPNANDIIVLNPSSSSWLSTETFSACFDVDSQASINSSNLSLTTSAIVDSYGNPFTDSLFSGILTWDTQQPDLGISLSEGALNLFDVGSQALTITLTFDKVMNTTTIPNVAYMSNQLPVTLLNTNSPASQWISDQVCSIVVGLDNVPVNLLEVDLLFDNIYDTYGNPPNNLFFENQFTLDTKKPEIESITSSILVINDVVVENNSFYLDIHFDEAMDVLNYIPNVSIRDVSNMILPGITFNIFESAWLNDFVFRAQFFTSDLNMENNALYAQVSLGYDVSGNPMELIVTPITPTLDSKNPKLVGFEISDNQLNQNTTQVTITSSFDEAMHEDFIPNYVALVASDSYDIFTSISGSWLNPTTFEGIYQVVPFYHEGQVVLKPVNAVDLAQNPLVDTALMELLEVDFLFLNITSNSITDVFVFPNPIKQGQLFTVQLPNGMQLASYEFLDMQGRRIHESKPSQIIENSIAVDFGLSAGVYFLALHSGAQSYIVRVQITN